MTLALAACSGENDVPSALADGSPTERPAVELEALSQPAVLTKVRALPVKAVRAGSPSAACLRAAGAPLQLRGRFVERVGVVSSTVTFATASGVHGCDSGSGAGQGTSRWCGLSFGVLSNGRLEDPRLDIAGCRSASGRPLGLAWIEPSRGTRYVAVEQDGFAEVYEPAAALPIRVTTATGVEVAGSRATFRLSEHDAEGRLLRRYELEAVPAG